MFDLSSLNSQELLTLKKQLYYMLYDTFSLSQHPDTPFYDRIMQLKADLTPLMNRKIALNIEGDDVFVRIEFKNGFSFSFDVLEDSSSFSIDKYNDDCFELLYLYSNNDDSDIDNLHIVLWDGYIATSNEDILKDSADEKLLYENILFVIRMDTVDYIFTDDIE